ncbi:hypothetical protein KLP28_11580 [Nocardioidaceae bacterium]|nr:hypothetical protein KLP28_11580 [Nocardioidaceae bacterium]
MGMWPVVRAGLRWAAAAVLSGVVATGAFYASVIVYFAYAGTDVSAPSISGAAATVWLLLLWSSAGAVVAAGWVAIGRPVLARWVGLAVAAPWLLEIGVIFCAVPSGAFAAAVLVVSRLMRHSNRDVTAARELASTDFWAYPRR